jgi:hypothetical protein
MAGNIGVSVLDLNSDVPDREALVNLVADLVKKSVVAGRSRHYQMNGKRGFPEVNRSPRDEQTENVAQVVAGVGKQRERMRGQTMDNLGDYEA